MMQNKSRFWVLISAVFIGLIIVGGCSLSQKSTLNTDPNTDTTSKIETPTKVEEKTSAKTEQDSKTTAKTNDIAVLYTDNTYKFKFTTSKDCEKYFKIAEAKSLDATPQPALKDYEVFTPLSVEWSKDPWFYLEVYTPEEYNKFNPDELPGAPTILLKLDSGNLVTVWGPQFIPDDQPASCDASSISAEEL